jgi:serine/threonine protein kinase
MAAHFDFIKRLGSGHFGEVWLVIDTGLNAQRALKLVHPSKLWLPANVHHEAQILKAAEHENVVHVEETGTHDDGRIYVAMEYLERGSLEDEAAGSYVDLTRAKRLMIDALRGLSHAHARNIIHRDIKPANILIGNSNEGKLSDFGLAIPIGLNLGAIGAKDYAYIMHLAPELHGARDFTIASDIYACGVTLYRLVNGDSYLPALSPTTISRAIVQGKYPDRTHYRSFIPRPLRSLVNKAMAVDPSKRFGSADEMRHSLEQITIEMNWKEQLLTNGRRWSCGWDNRCYEVTCLQAADGSWDVTMRKGKSKKELRRVNSLSLQQLNEVSAEPASSRILQDYVLGRLK